MDVGLDVRRRTRAKKAARAHLSRTRNLPRCCRRDARFFLCREPPIGTVSFFFICLQFARARGVGTSFEVLLRRRKERMLLERYPKYSRMVLLQWAEGLTPGQHYPDERDPRFDTKA